jgi:hypothetical protein
VITEPELTGASGGEPLRRAGADGQLADVVQDLGSRPGLRGVRGSGRGGWLWGALAGAAVASAVWAGAASAAPPAGRPDLHGFRIGFSPCAGGTFDALVQAVGGSAGTAAPATFSHGPALDGARCTFTVRSRPERGAVTEYAVALAVDLHRRTDPRAEFQQEAAVDPDTLTVAETATPLADVGDEAYALALQNRTELLKVLRGGAVITLRLTSTTTAAAPSREAAPDPSADSDPDPAPNRLVPALADAVRALLVTLAQ